jgi:hypothetical protein
MILPFVRAHAPSILLFIVCFGLRPAAFADPPSKEWGVVSKEQLAALTFPADSNATAVVLLDVGEASFEPNYDLVFHRHTRVKILTKEGYDWGR